MRIHHITLLTKNMSTNIAFYTTILGFRLVKNSVNQENPKMRHTFYADYVGTPGTVTTFIEVPMLGPRYDQTSYIQNLDYYAPTGSEQYWQERLTDYGIDNVMTDGVLHFKDFDDVPISFTFIDQLLVPEKVNLESTIPGDFQLLRLKNTNIYLEDFEQERNFFEKLLDQPITNQQITLEAGQTVSLLPSEHPGKKRFGRGSIDHVAFSVNNREKINQLVKIGNDNHFEIEKQIDRKYFYSLYFQDPNHNRIEFATLQPGFTVDEDIKHLGKILSLPERLENERPEILAHFRANNVIFDE